MKNYVVSNLKLRVISLQFLHEFIIFIIVLISLYILFIHRYLFTCKLLQKSPLEALIKLLLLLFIVPNSYMLNFCGKGGVCGWPMCLSLY